MEISITEVCRNLRQNSTPAEKVFWQIVRNRQIRGCKFNRQYPIVFEYDDDRRFFVADFYCHELRLVVEIDGGIHETQKDYDALRTTIINKLGYHVIRFSNAEVLKRINVVIGRLESIIEQLTPNPSPPACLRRASLEKRGQKRIPLLSGEKGQGDEWNRG